MSKDHIDYVIYVPMWWKISRKFLHHFDVELVLGALLA